MNYAEKRGWFVRVAACASLLAGCSGQSITIDTTPVLSDPASLDDAAAPDGPDSSTAPDASPRVDATADSAADTKLDSHDGKRQQVALPAFSVPGGTYTTWQTVSISTTTPSATIFYTIDGTTPSQASPKYVAPIPVAASLTLKAIAIADGYENSDVFASTYTIAPADKVGPPLLYPPGAEYTDSVTVTMSTATANATICYTTDSTTPTCDNTKAASQMCTGTSLRYTSTSAPTIKGSKTVRALACKAAMTNSDSVTSLYTFRASNPTASVSSGVVAWGTRPFVNVSTGSASLLVTKSLDGTPPPDPDVAPGTCTPVPATRATTSLPADLSSTSALSLPGNGSSGLKRNAKYKVRSCKVGFSLSSVVSLDYVVQLPAPVLYQEGDPMTLRAPSFGTVTSDLELYFRSPAADTANVDGAADVGVLCIGDDGVLPDCGTDMRSCSSHASHITKWAASNFSSLEPATVTGFEQPYAIWQDYQDNTYNDSMRRQFAVIACRPSTAPSPIVQGTWSW